MTHETLEAALARGVKIQYIARGVVTIDWATGCPQKKLESFRASSLRGSKSIKTNAGRPRKQV